MSLLSDIETHLKATRVFIGSREKMHSCGQEMHDDLLARVSSAAAEKNQRTAMPPPDTIARLTAEPAGEDVEADLRQALAWAYTQGATDVHDEWGRDPDDRPRGEPDFAEAASDYAKAAVDPFSSAARIPDGLLAALRPTDDRLADADKPIPDAERVVVPREPTPEMLRAGVGMLPVDGQAVDAKALQIAWVFMLAAAPKHPTDDLRRTREAEAVEIMTELADDLEAEVRERWGYDERLSHKLERDLAPVARARTFLSTVSKEREHG